MRTSRAIIFGVVGLVVIGGGAAAALEIQDSRAQDRQCVAISAQIAERGSIVETAKKGDAIAILGDSYSSGDGLESYKDAWSQQVGTHVAGVGMTGFVNGGYCGDGAFTERLDALLAASPGTLIIQGGLNDVGTPEDVEAAARTVLQRTAAVPRVIVVGPADVPNREGEAAVDHALRSAVSSSPAQYVSALDWDLEYLPDGVHLTPAGHAGFASQVKAAAF